MEQTKSYIDVETERKFLEDKLNLLIQYIGDIPIANNRIMPYGWRKAAKGRTVWRIVEEVISQNLESKASELGFDSVYAAESEVGVYDFRFCYDGNKESYVNIKSSVKDGRNNKDDISKAQGLIEFYSNNPNAYLYIATFVICFKEDMTIGLEKCIVFPTAWIPDIYVNPSNNGNLQSAKYKDIKTAVRRTTTEFLTCLICENEKAIQKKRKKQNMSL